MQAGAYDGVIVVIFVFGIVVEGCCGGGIDGLIGFIGGCHDDLF